MQDNFERKNHALTLENRNQLSMTGVSDVKSFNEEEINAKTDYGELLIKGTNLHVEVLDLDTGALTISGSVMALVYNDKVESKGGFRRFFA